MRLSYFNNGSGVEVLEESNYYPFGLKHEGYNNIGGNAAYQYKYNGKELQTESGMYDYGARMYMPDIGRWGVVDPLAEKYQPFSGYNYVLNNPISNIDPDGREVKHDYQLFKNGEVKMIRYSKTDKTDTLYASNDKGGVDKNKSITIQKGIVGQLQYYRDGNTSDGYDAYHQAIKESAPSTQSDMANLFNFSANNTTVEFSLTDFKIGEKRFISLQTYNSDELSPGMSQIGVEDGSEIRITHNHPANQTYATKRDPNFTERYSMGDKGKVISGDYENVVYGNGNPINYQYRVFFPGSKNLYDVTRKGINLIKQAKTGKDFR